MVGSNKRLEKGGSIYVLLETSEKFLACFEFLGQDLGSFHLGVVGNDFASLASELVVSIGGSTSSQLEEILEILGRESIDLLLVIDDRLKTLLGELTLKDLFLDSTRGKEPICEATFLLAVSPASSRSLLVNGRIPVRIKEHEPITANQVQTASTSLTREKKGNKRTRWIVEFVHHFLSLLHCHRAIKSTKSPVTLTTHFPNQIQSLSIVGYNHNLVASISGSTHFFHESI
mmetsp:Transcript_32550/g.58910  ORF Transcript_32550/g.58910 Transcript_32550/m.58910 type:complete len:231 (-) Transcript_32550:115-807(-)